jgi:hypothetical protein
MIQSDLSCSECPEAVGSSYSQFCLVVETLDGRGGYFPALQEGGQGWPPGEATVFRDSRTGGLEMQPFVSSRSTFSAVFVLVLIGCLLFQTGCATIFHGRMQTIEVTSDPPGARVFVNGKQMSSTPAEITVKRNSTVILRLEKKGYDPFEVKMKRGLSGWILADLLWGYLVFRHFRGFAEDVSSRLRIASILAGPGLGIDFLNGSAFKQRPSRLEVNLSALNDKEVAP